ncbi:MAG: carbon-nitrogen hydrolase family protein [Planctomycetota bacterium]|nr:carbon-nitrogen hydrolase family protein [Planctomycetota bacterium]
MKSGKIRIATCQFAESFNPRRNAAIIRRYMIKSKAGRVDLVHFHEACMSGYLTMKHAPAPDEAYWRALRESTESICTEAARLRLWVVLGSAHPLTPPHKPTNCLYLIGPDGRVRNRYDKRFCTPGDLKAYTPGDRFVIFTLNGVRCALLICYDLRFPELYRKLKKRRVQAIFQSFHNGYMPGPGIHEHIMRQTVQAQAGFNYFWISAANSSGYYSRWPGVFITPDGAIAATLQRNRAGMMINAIETSQKFYDAGHGFWKLAARGVLHSGKLIKDPRQNNHKCL